MNQAVEIFTRVPKTHNCVQAAAACCGLEGLAEALKPWEGADTRRAQRSASGGSSGDSRSTPYETPPEVRGESRL